MAPREGPESILPICVQRANSKPSVHCWWCKVVRKTRCSPMSVGQGQRYEKDIWSELACRVVPSGLHLRCWRLHL